MIGTIRDIWRKRAIVGYFVGAQLSSSYRTKSLGFLWALLDPGYLSYHEGDARRQYIRSPRAHSLVIADGFDGRTRESECLDWGRAETGDFARGCHTLPTGRHTRSVTRAAPLTLVIEDELAPAARRPIMWEQVFQLAPDLEVEIVSEREARLLSADGSSCLIRQSAAGAWRSARGETQPRLQGWFSARYGDWQPTTTLLFAPEPGTTKLRSELALIPAK